MKKINIFNIVSTVIFVWIVASYINTIINIDTQTYDYAWWNLITIIFG